MNQTFLFGDFDLEEHGLRLQRNGQPVEISTTPLRVLLCLVKRHTQVVSKEHLLQDVWADVRVSDWALSTALKEVRKVLGDDGQEQRWIRTERRRGYQFVPPVRVVERAPLAEPGTRLIGIQRGPSMSFVGRSQELRALETLLLQDSYVGSHIAVEGLAGVGKTELALQLVHKLVHAGSFPGGVFWLPAERSDLTAVWGCDLADRAGIPEGRPQERCAALLRRIESSRHPALIVLDNVSSWLSADRPSPLPTGAHVRVLATTRVRNLGGGSFHHLELELLDAQGAGELLRVLAGRNPDPGTDELLGELAGHTLAIEIAASFLRTYRGETAQSCLETLRRMPGDLDRSVQGRLAYERSIEGAYRTAWDRLSEPARQAWQIAACFAHEPASGALLQAAGVEPESVRELEDLHLLQCNPDARWSMHRLTKAFALGTGAHELERARRAFVSGCARWASAILSPIGLRAYAEDRVHFDVALELAPRVLDRELELHLLRSVGGALMLQDAYSADHVTALYGRALRIARSEKSPRDVMAVLEGLWTHQVLRGDWVDAEAIARSAHEAASADGIGQHALGSLAMSAASVLNQGRVREAQDLIEQAFALFAIHPFEFPRQITWEPRMSALATGAMAACVLGSPDQGRALADEMSSFSAFLRHPVASGMTAIGSTMLHQFRGSFDAAGRDAADLVALGAKHHVPMFLSLGRIMSGWVEIKTGRSCTPHAWRQMRDEMDVLLRRRIALTRTYWMTLLADAALTVGQPAAALASIDRALAIAEQDGERLYVAELWRLRARCMSSCVEASGCLDRAIRIAEQQEAHWWRLRACADLCEHVRSTRAPSSELRAADERLRAAVAAVRGSCELPDLRRAAALLRGTS